jgi:hypothetical protein
MPSNKTLLVWLCISNVFWGICLTLILYSTSRRDAEIADLQTKVGNQDEYDKMVTNANLTLFRIVAAKIQDSQNDIEQLQKSCGLKSKEIYQ